MTSYLMVAKQAQAELESHIPHEWRLDSEVLTSAPRDVRGIIEASNILSERDREITNVRDATALLEKIHSGEWSAEEVTVAFCKRASLAHQLVKPLMFIDYTRALVRARELDDHFCKTGGGTVGPLHGLPDLTNWTGTRVTIGYVAWANRFSNTDAVLVQTLRKAGAVFYVKTTMPQNGMMLETVSNLWGRTLNPSNTLLCAGGSSGGEGALLGTLASPLGIGSDIGGSIRAPSAFNGLYGFKPTAGRLSAAGNNSTIPGQIGVLATVGPMGRSVRDLKLLCEVASADEPWFKDPKTFFKPWVSATAPKRLTLGVMWWDGIVMPHPPLRRAMSATVEKLRLAGHEVIDFEPFDHQRGWDITLPIYFATGGAEVKELLDKGGAEPVAPSGGQLIDQTKPLTVAELYKYHSDRDAYNAEYLAHWNATASRTQSAKPIDAILCSPGPCIGYPHDFLPWWPYFSTFNLLNYPALTVPVLRASAELDPKDTSYRPVGTPDKRNHDIYDPSLYDGMLASVQLVGRTFADENLLAVAEVVDEVMNGSNASILDFRKSR